MKKAFVLAFCVLGFFLIAAPTAVEYAQVFVNGKPFAQATRLNNTWVVPVEALATALGGTLTLQDAGLTINGGKLNAVVSSYSAQHKGESQLKIKLNPGSTVPTDQYKEYKITPGQAQNKAFIKGESHAQLKVNRAGTIGNVLVNGDGKAFISVKAFASALGTTVGDVRTGEAVQIHFTNDPRAILIGL
jgi:hypothetical protein